MGPAEGPRKLSVLPHRQRKPHAAGDPRRRGGEQHERARDADHDPQQGAHERGQGGGESRGDADERRLEPLLPERGAPTRGGQSDDRHRPHERGHDDDEPDRAEERPRQRAARLTRLLREVRDRLQAGEGQHGERQREREIAPAEARVEREAVHEPAW